MWKDVKVNNIDATKSHAVAMASWLGNIGVQISGELSVTEIRQHKYQLGRREWKIVK